MWKSNIAVDYREGPLRGGVTRRAFRSAPIRGRLGTGRQLNHVGRLTERMGEYISDPKVGFLRR